MEANTSRRRPRLCLIRDIMSASKMVLSDVCRNPRDKLDRLHRDHRPAIKRSSELDSTHAAGLAPDPDRFDLYSHPDLLSRDRAKQKEAIRQYLFGVVKADWDFDARSDDSQDSQNQAVACDNAAESESDESDGSVSSTSVYSSVYEDLIHFRSRVDWASDRSDPEITTATPRPAFASATAARPEAVQVTQSAKDSRRRATRRESRWNDGLARYEARRNAWTGARTVRVIPKASHKLALPGQEAAPGVSLALLSPWTLFARKFQTGPDSNRLSTSSPAVGVISLTSLSVTQSPFTVSEGIDLPPARLSADLCTQKRGHRRIQSTSSVGIRSGDNTIILSSTKSSVADCLEARPSVVETITPIPRPLLPLANPMRASIGPAVYMSIYDKVIVQNLTPSCPINLADIVRSCVVGWKRDGEWPPRSTPTAASGIITSTATAASLPTTVTGECQLATSPTGCKSSLRRRSIGFIHRHNHENVQKDSNEPQDDTGRRGVRRGLQRVLGLGNNHTSDYEPISSNHEIP